MNSTEGRDSLLINLLAARRKTAEKELRVQQKELKKLEKEPVLVRDEELLTIVSHAVGYLEGVVHETDIIISLLGLSREGIMDYIEKKRRIERENKAHLKKLFSSVAERVGKDL